MESKLLSAVWIVFVLLGVAVLVSIGVISLVVAAIVFSLVAVGLLVFYSGGTSLVRDVSDHEGYERAVQEQEEEEYEAAGGGGFDDGGDDGPEGGDNTLTAGKDEYILPEGSYTAHYADIDGGGDDGELEMVDELEAPQEHVHTPKKAVKLR